MGEVAPAPQPSPRPEGTPGPAAPASPAPAAVAPAAVQPPPAPPAGEAHAPVLKRRRLLGQPKDPFRRGGRGRWVAGGIAVLALTILLPFLWPRLAGLNERIATLASLVFLAATPGLAMGMGRRALVVSACGVALLYLLSIWGGLALSLEDFFLLAVVASFALFLLAGLNLVFVLEEVVYDIHRLLVHPRNRAWLALPPLVFAALAAGLQAWAASGGPSLPALRWAAWGTLLLVGSWWFVRAFNHIRGQDAIVRELHLLAFSVLGAAALLDGIPYLQEASELVPSLVAYLVLLGTWVYVNYTTLQRAHFLLKARDPGPWIAILLSASFAIVAHAQGLYRIGGHVAVEDLVAQRISYMVVGVATGIAFLVARGLWRGLSALARESRVPASGRRAAHKAERVAGSLLATEHAVEEATRGLFAALDAILPGQHQPPQRRAGGPSQAGAGGAGEKGPPATPEARDPPRSG